LQIRLVRVHRRAGRERQHRRTSRPLQGEQGVCLNRASSHLRISQHMPNTCAAPPSPLANRARAFAATASLVSYYDRHLAIVDGVALEWTAQGAPRPLPPRCRQVGVSKDASFALRDTGELVAWTDAAPTPRTLMAGVQYFAAGASGCFAIDMQGVLWHADAAFATPAVAARVAQHVVAACIGDGADYYITRNGALFVRGLAHRGQYGDGALHATTDFVSTARNAVDVKAHTGHAIYLAADGTVWGTGGNRFGPLSTHGLGDMATHWGAIFDGCVAIATGSRHTVALRANASLWAWGDGFAIAPARIHGDVIALAAGDTVTLARTSDGALWQWDRGAGPRRLPV
jgi:hypothetical protein